MTVYRESSVTSCGCRVWGAARTALVARRVVDADAAAVAPAASLGRREREVHAGRHAVSATLVVGQREGGVAGHGVVGRVRERLGATTAATTAAFRAAAEAGDQRQHQKEGEDGAHGGCRGRCVSWKTVETMHLGGIGVPKSVSP